MSESTSFRIHKYYNGKRNKNYELDAFNIIKYITSLGYKNPSFKNLNDCYEEDV